MIMRHLFCSVQRYNKDVSSKRRRRKRMKRKRRRGDMEEKRRQNKIRGSARLSSDVCMGS